MQIDGNNQPHTHRVPVGESNTMSKNRSRATEVVMVTGCSSGIGKTICEHLGKSNVRVYGGSRSECTPESWAYLKVDVTDETSVQSVIDEIVRREGRIDAVVCCAGVGLAGPVEETTVEEASQHFNVNYFGAVRTIRAVLPAMRRQTSGKIIVIGSIGGLIGLPYVGHYSAAKFALDGLIEALRTEVEPFGIQATVIHPGDFNTAFVANRVYSANTTAQSPYHKIFVKTCEFYAASEANGPAPTAVARGVKKALGMRRLPARIIVGSPLEILGVWGKSMLPSRGFEYLFRKAYGP
jgi:NAD(P)-dependent dehydrogenase (short-subunit alcohol dehydrogenase family)